MKSPSRTVFSVVFSVLLISLLAACNNPIGSRGSSGSSKPQAPAATSAVQPAIAQPTAKPNTLQDQPVVPAISTPQTTNPSVIDTQSDTQGDEIERSLDDLTNELNSTDTVDDLK